MISRAAILVGLVVAGAAASPITVDLVPSADTFVRAQSPQANYGSRGALSVAGPGARNGGGELVGPAESFMRFDVGQAVSAFDAQFGPGSWQVTGVSLKLVEFTTPPNMVFGRGKGAFEVRWLAADDWQESTLTWDNKDDYLDAAADVSLGTFTNLFQGDQYGPVQEFPLDLPAALLGDVRGGGEVSVLLAPAGDDIGFTFNSRNITGRPKPLLAITADVPEPASSALLAGMVAAAGLLRRGRRRRGGTPRR
ncbi:MAG: DNRLRE domain-containing protein [Planctomycetes bacterium]|nr:DNRLRE domain-containing protein [Planctomycetota bacterium]